MVCLLTWHACLLHFCYCSGDECSKNHFEHYEHEEEIDGTITITKHAKIHFVHHKNERKAGPAIIPVAPEMVDVLIMLEQAANHLAPNCPTIWSSSMKMPYGDEYWSHIGKGVLTDGDTPCTARDMRHEFSTWWRNFIDHAPASVLQMLGNQVEEAAAYLMGNTTSAWDATYDDNIRTRAKDRVIKLYPKFVEYVKAEAAKKKQMRPRNPHNTNA